MKTMSSVFWTASIARPTALLPSLVRWLDTSRQRHTLRHLSDAQLKDIGVSRAEAETEASRPFWDRTPRR